MEIFELRMEIGFRVFEYLFKIFFVYEVKGFFF